MKEQRIVIVVLFKHTCPLLITYTISYDALMKDGMGAMGLSPDDMWQSWLVVCLSPSGSALTKWTLGSTVHALPSNPFSAQRAFKSFFALHCIFTR